MTEVTFEEKDIKFGATFSESEESFSSGFGEIVGATDHATLSNREKPDQHPISSISNLDTRLESIMASVEDEMTEPLSNLELEKLLQM